MNIQAFIVTLIIIAATFYIGLMLWRKTKSFAVKNSACAGPDCGCDEKGKK
jgi:hypothetical protein